VISTLLLRESAVSLAAAVVAVVASPISPLSYRIRALIFFTPPCLSSLPVLYFSSSLSLSLSLPPSLSPLSERRNAEEQEAEGRMDLDDEDEEDDEDMDDEQSGAIVPRAAQKARLSTSAQQGSAAKWAAENLKVKSSKNKSAIKVCRLLLSGRFYFVYCVRDMLCLTIISSSNNFVLLCEKGR
jgi:hypothetical protein